MAELIAYTPENLADIDWRLKWLYSLEDKNRQLVTFRHNAMQQDYRKRKSNRNIILKSRQLGFTTAAAIEMLDDTLFTPSSKNLIIAHEKQEALKIFDNKVDFAWRNIEEKLKPIWHVNTETSRELKFEFVLPDGSRRSSSISVSESGRSGTYNHVHVSEFGKMCAKYPHKVREVITGTFNAVPLDGEITIESTAEGETGEFYEMFWDSWIRQGRRNWDHGMTKLPVEFAAFFYNWQWDHEEIEKAPIFPPEALPKEFIAYQAEHKLSQHEISYYYLKWLSLAKDWTALRQEYPTTPEEAFISSGEKLFDVPDRLKWDFRDGIEEGDWRIFEPYSPSGRYAMGVDVAEGVGGDMSACVIWNFATTHQQPKPRVVATYSNNKIAPDALAYIIRDMGNRFGTCLVAPERNNHGHTTIATLKGIYPIKQIYSKRVEDTDDPKGKVTEKLGWETNMVTKPRMLFDLRTAVNAGLIECPSSALAYEMQTYDKGELARAKADPNRTRHFDLLIAAAIGFQMKNEASVYIRSIPRGGTEGGVEGYM